ncbi:MAG: XRE family transcriptional regulator [Campylobacteraceae bacterium]|jgi:hypothetical protein|nr:XRE family transcriptional regulator [Campylobacteraceae bacterium]
MTNGEFAKRLKEVNLTRKEFAAQVGYAYQAVLNWSNHPIPTWVDSWLKHYDLAQKYTRLLNDLRRI